MNLSGPLKLELYLSLSPNSDEQRVFEGIVLHITQEPLKRVMRVDGRDYSCLLDRSSVNFSFINQTSSEIALFIASRHGFDARVSPTTTLVGSYANPDHSQVVLNSHGDAISELSLLSKLSKKEKFEFFMRGASLIFSPVTDLPTADYLIKTSDVQEIRFSQEISSTTPTTAVVKSWDSWSARGISSLQTDDMLSQTTGNSNNFNSSTDYLIVLKPNLSSNGAIGLADQIQSNLQQTAIQVEFSGPYGAPFFPRDTVTIFGGISDLNGQYIVRDVKYRFSSKSGLLQRVRGSQKA